MKIQNISRRIIWVHDNKIEPGQVADVKCVFEDLKGIETKIKILSDKESKIIKEE